MSLPDKKSSAVLRASLAAGAALLLVSGLAVFAGAALAASSSLPTNTTPPTISGTPTQGQKLTASTGSWTGSTPLSFSYHWQRCDASGGSCTGPVATTSELVLGNDSV